jgi:hypothetical protein
MSFFFKKYLLFEIFLLFLLSLTPLLWIGNGYVIFGYDSGFRVNILHHMQMIWNTFNPSINTGVDWSLYKGFLIIQLPELLLQTVLGSLEGAQPFILIFWFFLMAISMYIAAVYLFPEREKRFFRLYASIFWVLNFYILQAWFVAERAKFSLYAALPLSIVLFIAVFEKRINIISGSLLFGFLYFFCNGGGSPPLFGASIIVWITTWVYFSLVKRNILLSCKIGFGFLVAFFMFNAYWILPQIELARGTYTAAVSSEGGIEGLIAWEREISKYASIGNLLRLQGFFDWYNNPDHPYSHEYVQNPLLVALSYVPLVSIFLGICFFRTLNKKFILFLFILLFAGLFFCAGSHGPTGNMYLLLMRKVPGFAIFRSSFLKFAPLVWFSIIVLSGYYLQAIIDRYKKMEKLIPFMIIILILYHLPFFSTIFFTFSKEFTPRVKIPAYVKTTAKKLNEDATIGRVLIVPELDKGFINKPIDTYSWGYYSLDLLPRVVSDVSFVANDSAYEIVEALYNALYKGERENVLQLASILHITHILYRGDVKFSHQARKISVQEIETIFGTPDYTDGEWRVYSLNNTAPQAYSTQNIIPLVSVQNPSIFASSSSATIQVDWETAKRMHTQVVGFQAECFYCSEGEYNSFIQSITLPRGRYKKPAGKDIDSIISASLFSLGQYMNTRSMKFLGEYKRLIEEMMVKLNVLKDRQADFYRARALAFLIKQRELGDLAVQEILSPLIATLQKDNWVSSESTYRFGITLPVQGMYTVKSTDGFFNTITEISSGYHRFEIPKSNGKDPPKLLLVLESEPRHGGINNLIVFPYSYDSRWKFDGKHVMTNGYANGWLSDIPIEEFKPVYTPHKIFQIGLVISGFSIAGSVLLLIKRYAVK